MSRFYTPAQAPQFIEGMYTPPWELINKNLEVNQQGYDNTLATTNLFNDLDIQHIDDPVIREQAEKIKSYYGDKSQAITEAIQKDPMAWKRAMPNIQNLGRELSKDMKEGDIARMGEQYNSLAKFTKDHEEYKRLHPEDYNRGFQYYYDQFRKDPLRRGAFNWETLANPIDQKAIIDEVQKIKASSAVTPNGDYLVGTETIPKEQIEMVARNNIMGRPENLAYLQQQIKFKNPDYYDAEYENLHPNSGGLYEEFYTLPSITDSNGNIIRGKILTNEDREVLENKYKDEFVKYLNLSDKDKMQTPPPKSPFERHQGAVGRMINEAVGAASYTKNTIASDPAKLARFRAGVDVQISKNNIDLKEKQFKITTALAIQKNNVAKLNAINSAIANMDELNPALPKLQKLQADLALQTIEATDETVDETASTGKMNTPVTASLEIPPTMGELAIAARNEKGSRNAKMFNEYISKLKEYDKTLKVDKRVIDKKGENFVDFYKAMAGKDNFNTYTIEDLIDKYLVEKLNWDSGSGNVNKDAWANYLKKHYGPILKDFDTKLGELSKISKQVDVVHLTEQGTTNLKEIFNNNPTSFSMYEVNGDIIKTSGAPISDGRAIEVMSKGEIGGVLGYPIGNGREHAFTVKIGSKRYVAVLNAKNEGIASSMTSILRSSGNVQGNTENPYNKLALDNFAYDIAKGLANTPKEQDDNGNYFVRFKTVQQTESGEDLEVEIRAIDKKGEGRVYSLSIDGEPIKELDTPILNSTINAEGKMEKGIVDKLREILAVK